MEAVLQLLADDVVSWTDSGGRVSGARRPVVGADRCARFWAGLGRKGYPGARVQRVRVNGGPGFVVRAEGRPTRVIGLSIAGGRVREIFVFANPDRLGRLPPEG